MKQINSVLLDRAERFATIAHQHQTYGDEFPYMMHIRAAVAIARRVGITDVQILAAVWLHDTLEDNLAVTYNDIVCFFGQDIADIVNALSEPKVGTRKERHDAAYPIIRQHPYAVVAKLCDRLSHLEAGGKKLDMYVKEHGEFKQYFYDVRMPEILQSPVEQLWSDIDTVIINNLGKKFSGI